MSIIFEGSRLNTMELENRFVRSATWEAMATDQGFATETLNDTMAELARGKVGLIISGHAFVSAEGQAGPRQLGVYSDTCIPGLTAMAQAAHAEGGKIILQLAHAGCQAAVQLTGEEAIGPSAIVAGDKTLGRAMTVAEIERTVEAFGSAAGRAKQAGFDGVQLHAAHGYLLSQFISPFFNQRDDAYGGDPEKRSRLLLEVYRRVRSYTGDDFAVLIKINSEDFLTGGQDIDGMLDIVSRLEPEGIDAVEISGGTGLSGKFLPVRPGRLDDSRDEGYYRYAAKRYKEKISAPLILVGGIRSYEVCAQLITAKIADYIALSRPLIREPHLIKRWQSGDRSPSQCLSDNLCFSPVPKGKPVYCVTAERQRKSAESS